MAYVIPKRCTDVESNRRGRHYTVSATVLSLVLVAGCGESGAELGEVSGTVTLDGKPLAGAQVDFQPQPGAPSRGRTDATGRYELSYTRDRQGALIGSHTVRITTFHRGGDENDRVRITPEKLPERYHTKTTLTAKVDPGSNVINFELRP